MFRRIRDFTDVWAWETDITLRVLGEITDPVMDFRPSERDRSLGELAWHIVTAIHEIGGRTGLALNAPGRDTPVPSGAKVLRETYRASAADLAERAAAELDDASLLITDDVYGERWAKGRTLFVLLCHQVHHRGQLTSIYRLAGLRVPAIYGPSRDEWSPGKPRPSIS